MCKTKVVILLFVQALFTSKVNSQDLDLNWVDSIFNRAIDQYELMVESVPDYNTYPRSVFDENAPSPGSTRWVDAKNWVAGFYPGVLWNFYKHTEDTSWANLALSMCDTMLILQLTSYDPVINCDLGFIYFTALLPAYEYTGDDKYKNKLLEAADALKGRFSSIVGSSDSWDYGSYKNRFYVIIDHLMSLDLLLWATEITNDTTYRHAALTHANTAIKDQFRIDYSPFSIEYDSVTGAIVSDISHQNKLNQYAWSRGTNWAIYAYTTFARLTEEEKYLSHAEGIANFWVNHQNMTDDHIPYQDINDASTNQYKDASAACINTAGLIELCKLSKDYGSDYYSFAKHSLKSLASPDYFSAVGQNNYFLIMHGNGGTNEHDVALIYADYYFTQALIRYKNSLISNKNKPVLLDTIPDQIIEADSLLTISILASDLDGDELTFTAPNIPPFAALTDNLDGTATLTINPENHYVGQYEIVIKVSDNYIAVYDTINVSINGFLSLNQISGNDLSLRIFPNPVGNQMNIIFKDLPKESPIITVMNIHGEIVLNEIITSDVQTIDLSNLLGGMYILSVVTGNKSIRKKFVKH